MNIGSAISTTRRMKGLSQADVAAKVGISVSTLSLIESSKRSVNIERICTIADCLGVHPLFLFAFALSKEEKNELPEQLVRNLDYWRMDNLSPTIDVDS